MIRLYNCFHDSGSTPNKKYISDIRCPLLCGTNSWHRTHDDITIDCLKDNVGENISDQNTQYSELTGYYWIWKNENVDYVGIEHYRRHFIKHIPITENYVKPENLLDEKDILTILSNHDYIIPVYQTLANTTVYDLYVICFGDQATDMVRYMKRYFIEKGLNNYLNVMYDYMSHNILYRANMLITNKAEFDNYCSVLFDMIDFMKENMTVKPDSRVWGYVAELFPKIYIDANNKTYQEIDMAVDDRNYETKEEYVFTTIDNKIEPFDKDITEQLNMFKSL